MIAWIKRLFRKPKPKSGISEVSMPKYNVNAVKFPPHFGGKIRSDGTFVDEDRRIFSYIDHAYRDGPNNSPEGWWGVWHTGLYRWVRSTSAHSDEGIVAFPTKALAEEEARFCSAEMREDCIAKPLNPIDKGRTQ